MNKYLSVKQAMERLGMSDFTIRKLIRTGKLKATKVGYRMVRILEEDLNSFMNGNVIINRVEQEVEKVNNEIETHTPLTEANLQ